MFDNNNFVRKPPHIKVLFSLPAVGRRGGKIELKMPEVR